MEHQKIQWKYPEALVSCEWLNQHLNDKNVRIFDCTTYLHYTDYHPSKPYDAESGRSNYKKGKIPGASFIDIQGQLSNQKSPFHFTIPDYVVLAESLHKIGVGNPFHIVLYSTNAPQWASRVWWLIHILGFKKVSILDGGFSEWKRLGFKSEKGESVYETATFSPNIDGKIFVDKEHTLGSINKRNCVLLNALSRDLHSGANPRYGRPGRIPGSENIPASQFLEPGTQKLLSPEKALELVQKKNISETTKVLNYCGGGIAATLNAFVLRQLGIENLEIYDNSMSEWAMDAKLPIETDN